MPETIALADFRYSARFARLEKHIRFQGPNGFFDAALLRGSLDSLAGLAFSQLSRPTGLLARVRRCAWRVWAPRHSAYHPGVPVAKEANGFDNMGENRRILQIEGPEVLVLRFKRPIPRGLIFALKTLFTGQEYEATAPGLLAPATNKEVAHGPGQEGSE